jgi:VanZ family protein
MMPLVISWLPPAAWAALIFWLSSMPGLSSGLAFDFLLRKAAHITEYFILTLLLVRAFRRTWRSAGPCQAGLSSFRLAAYPALIVLLYAFSDEFHQSFVVGRNCSLTDVLIDAAGIVVCVLVVLRRSGM